MFVLAIDKATNASLPISLFQIYSYGLAGDFAATSEVSPSKSLFPYNPGSGPTETQAWVMSHTMFGTIKRSLPARALTYTMFSINWVLALCSMVTTSVSFHRGSGNNDVGMTLLPITVILSIPTIRNLYVGSPPFGIFIGKSKGSRPSPPPRTDSAFRRGWVLPTNADSGVVHRDSIVWLCGQVHADERSWEWGEGGSGGSGRRSATEFCALKSFSMCMSRFFARDFLSM